MAMEAGYFHQRLKYHGIGFFAGVPDSLLKPFCAYVAAHTSPDRHVICANEGAAVGMAVGHHLATGDIALVYMQNSGLGNAVNPLMSLADTDVYSVPVLLMIGWRGQPGFADEPQHKKQGRITLDLLDVMGIPFRVLNGDPDEATQALARAVEVMIEKQAPFALVIRKGAFEPYPANLRAGPVFPLTREAAIQQVIDALEDRDIVVSTTGMASREVFEYREALKTGHARDFLTVGGMGHSSQIALGIAINKQDRGVWCIDGDGSVLMHMGSLAINGIQRCRNFHHVVINNGAHDSVGGQPTVGLRIDFQGVARAAGYATVTRAVTRDEIRTALEVLKRSDGPSFLEIRVRKGNRPDLGRPTTTPLENKQAFMGFLK